MAEILNVYGLLEVLIIACARTQLYQGHCFRFLKYLLANAVALQPANRWSASSLAQFVIIVFFLDAVAYGWAHSFVYVG